MSELTERLRKAAYQVRSPRATDVLALCDEHERLEAELTLAQKRDVDNFTTCAEYVTTKKTIFLDLEAVERTIQVANNPMVGVRLLVEEIHQLRRAHERLEAELAVSKKHGALDVMRERDEARTDFIRTQNELWCLEGLLRAWVASGEGGPVWSEAVRLAGRKG